MDTKKIQICLPGIPPNYFNENILKMDYVIFQPLILILNKSVLKL
jgi:hypothetical protein